MAVSGYSEVPILVRMIAPEPVQIELGDPGSILLNVYNPAYTFYVKLENDAW